MKLLLQTLTTKMVARKLGKFMSIGGGGTLRLAPALDADSGDGDEIITMTEMVTGTTTECNTEPT